MPHLKRLDPFSTSKNDPLLPVFLIRESFSVNSVKEIVRMVEYFVIIPLILSIEPQFGDNPMDLDSKEYL